MSRRVKIYLVFMFGISSLIRWLSEDRLDVTNFLLGCIMGGLVVYMDEQGRQKDG